MYPSVKFISDSIAGQLRLTTQLQAIIHYMNPLSCLSSIENAEERILKQLEVISSSLVLTGS
jgi:hypothetical protein